MSERLERAVAAVAAPDAAVQVGFDNGGRADVYLYLDAA